VDKISKSKEILTLAAEMSEHYYHKPIIICYSGGKDSDVILRLAMEVLRPEQFEVLHSITTVDSPITNKYVNDIFKELKEKGIKCEKSIPVGSDGKPTNMWKLIPEKKMPPTRIVRYCCQTLKETSTPNRVAILGVRADESSKRKGRDVFGVRGGSYSEATFFSLDHTAEVHREALEKEKEPNGTVWDCTLIKVMRDQQDTVVSPIYEWSDSDVWDYLNRGGWKHNPMYDMGYHRVGCIGCPLATYKQKLKEFSDFPSYKKLYIAAFEEMIKQNPKAKWKSGEEVFDWWIEKDKHETRGQLTINDYLKEQVDEWGLIVRDVKEKNGS
jgi:phosphoadenosine phosphosulfate reductase